MADDSMFTCPHCERAFKWSEEIAGRRVRCKCGEKILVPESLGDPGASQYELDLDDESGQEGVAPATAPTATEGPVCPSCSRPVKPGAAICISCGTDLRSGKKLTTKKGTVEVDAPPTTQGPVGAEAPTGGNLKIAAWSLMAHFFGFILYAGGIVLSLASIFALIQSGGNAAAGVVAIVLSLLPLIALVVVFLSTFGLLAAPAEAGRPILIVGLVCYGLGLILDIGVRFELASGGLNAVLGFVSILLSLVGVICIAVFLGELASYVDREDLKGHAQLVVKAIFVAIGAALGLFIPVLNFGFIAVAGIAGIVGAALYVITAGRLAFHMVRR